MPRVKKQTTKIIVAAAPGKRSKRKSKGRRHARPAGPNVSALVHKICSVTDPFCEAASGAKWPDADTTVATLPWTARGYVPITTDANGDASVMFCPELLRIGSVNLGPRYATGTVSGSSVGYGSWGVVGGDPSLINIIGTQRIVSAGVKAITTTSLNTSQGVAYFQQVAGGTNMDLINAPFGSLNYPRVDTFSLKSSVPIFHIFKAGSMDSRTLSSVDTSDEVVNTDTDDWSILQIQVVGGAPNTTVMNVEFVAHYEFTIKGVGGFLNSVATPPPRAHPAVIQASKDVAITLPTLQGSVQSIGAIVHQSAMQAIKGLAQTGAVYAARAVGSYFGGPVAGHLAGGATRLAIQDLD